MKINQSTNTAIQNLLKKQFCYVPICKAKCCISPPLPKSFIYIEEGNLQRSILRLAAVMKNGKIMKNPIYGESLIPITVKYKLEKGKFLDVSSLEDNYCPFITEKARCNVYERRPKICKDFGDKNECNEKLTYKQFKYQTFKTNIEQKTGLNVVAGHIIERKPPIKKLSFIQKLNNSISGGFNRLLGRK